MTAQTRIRGVNKLVAHVPDFGAGFRPIIGLIALLSFAAATVMMVAIDQLWPASTGFGQIAAIIIGFVLAGQFFWRRQAYRAKWGALAYRNAFVRFILSGPPMIFAALAHNAYLPGARLLLGWAGTAVLILGLFLFVSGLVLWVRSILTFGIDNLAMLYVYFPNEGQMVNSSIYSVIRHPVYSAVAHLGLALGLWRGTWFSIAFGLFMPVGLLIWLRFVEEPELIERFGDGYAAYRRKVPAFWPRVQNWKKFFRFLITGR